MAGEIPRNILSGDQKALDAALNWHKKVFGEDYYLEVMLHKTEVSGLSLDLYNRQKEYCGMIFSLAREYGIKVVATNDVHYLNKEDWEMQDMLLQTIKI